MLRNGVNWLSNVIKQCYSLERDSSPAGQLIRSNLLNSLQEPHYWTKPFGTNLQHQSLFILRSVTVLFSHLCPHIFRQKKNYVFIHVMHPTLPAHLIIVGFITPTKQ